MCARRASFGDNSDAEKTATLVGAVRVLIALLGTRRR